MHSRSADRLGGFERRQAREHTVSRARTLRIFEALWVEACRLNPDFPGPWEEDIEPDLAVAMALNHLPPDP